MDRDWRVQKYGPLGWMESIVKLIAAGVGIASLSIYNNNSEEPLLVTRIVQIVFMAITGAVLIGLIAQRVLDKELLAIIFIVVQVIGHWIMVLVLVLSIDPGPWIFTYVFLMILGEYIKMLYLLLAENPEVRFFNKPILFAISAGFILLFIGVIIVQVIIWLIEY